MFEAKRGFCVMKMRMMSNGTKLIVLRGPSGSGKSAVAKAVRATQGHAMALVEQDYLRRILLKEKDIPGGVNIELIKRTAIFVLENSYNVIMEGIFDASRYEEMFDELLALHPENNFCFYFDISLEETLRRHKYKPNKNDFGEAEMRSWYKKEDFLPCLNEVVIPESNTLDESIRFISEKCGLIS